MNERQRQLFLELINNLSASNFISMMKKYGDDPDWQAAMRAFSNKYPDVFNQFYGQYLTEQVQSGEMSGNDAYGSMAQFGGAASDELSKYLDNQISNEKTLQEQDYQTTMRDTSLLSSGSQLTQLGLSPSSVVQVGGASSGVGSAITSQNMHSANGDVRQIAMNRYNQRMSLARSLIGAAGQMASSGIYGSALGAIKNSAQRVAASAANSGLEALKAMRPELRQQLMIDEAARSSQLPRYNEL